MGLKSITKNSPVKNLDSFKEVRKPCGTCLKNDTCDSSQQNVKLGDDKSVMMYPINNATCGTLAGMCEECIKGTIDDDHKCGESDEDRLEWVPECRKYLEKAGKDVPMTPEESIILFAGGGGLFFSCSSCLCLILMMVLMKK